MYCLFVVKEPTQWELAQQRGLDSSLPLIDPANIKVEDIFKAPQPPLSRAQEPQSPLTFGGQGQSPLGTSPGSSSLPPFSQASPILGALGPQQPGTPTFGHSPDPYMQQPGTPAMHSTPPSSHVMPGAYLDQQRPQLVSAVLPVSLVRIKYFQFCSVGYCRYT